MPTPLRLAVERRSAGLLTWLSAKPKVVIPLLSVALLVGGLALPPAVGAPLLLALLLLVGWLSYLSWPVVSSGARTVRLVLLALLVVALVTTVLDTG